jgi:hypothetical protein
VLLDEDFNVKISGFQMSRVLSNPGRFHELKMADRLPTKWFALETLTSDRFNPYTDGNIIRLISIPFLLLISVEFWCSVVGNICIWIDSL